MSENLEIRYGKDIEPTLIARRLAGWRRFAPTLLAFWGLTWAALGYAIFSEARRKEVEIAADESRRQ